MCVHVCACVCVCVCLCVCMRAVGVCAQVYVCESCVCDGTHGRCGRWWEWFAHVLLEPAVVVEMSS